MADLTAKTLTNGYPNLVTVGATTDDNPTSGQLENGKGNAITEIGIGKTPTSGIEFDVNGEIRASGGILFGTDTAAANALDDYEEGTWTPVYVGSGGGSAIGGTVIGRYTKIGNTVTVDFRITADKNTLSGDITISGLPFTPASAHYGVQVAPRRRFATQFDIFAQLSGTSIQLFKIDSDGLNQTELTDTDLDSTAADTYNDMCGAFTYFV